MFPIVVLLLATIPSVAHAEGVRKEGNVWLPATIKKGEPVPVLIVYQGGVDEELLDLEALVRDHRLAIVHASQGRAFGREQGSRGIPGGIKVALSEASRVYPAILRAPCVLGSFGKAGGLMNALFYAGFIVDHGLQGVVSVQPTFRTSRAPGPSGTPPDLPKQPGLRALLLETEGGVKSTAEGIVDDVASAGIRAMLERVDAKPDLVRSLAWVRELGLTGKLGIVGSSYSSSLAIIVGAENKGVSAVVSFSPANRIPPNNTVVDAAKNLKVPTLVVCPPKEKQRAEEVFEPIAAKEKRLYIQPQGVHGASTLYQSQTFPDAWKVLLTFLDKHLK